MGVFMYFLDKKECEGNRILRHAGSFPADVRVYLYRRQPTHINFEGIFKVMLKPEATKSREVVFLKRQQSASEASGANGDLAKLHEPILYTACFRSKSEEMHFHFLVEIFGERNLEHEPWTRNNIQYTWNGQQKVASYLPDFIGYKGGLTYIIESKCSVDAINTDENVQKMAALSKKMPDNHVCLLVCDHGDRCRIFQYKNAELVPYA
uniref:Uncharacterized protein n=1 Tax=viral metagenome TaxID=1070528 RepID=A0A6C0KEZ5_9ZZZZ